MEFEKIQLDILASRDKNQLVSAGAGSGKTTVMIEKIADLIIKDKVPIDNLLVVTFTVMASGEMKSRLIEKLNDKLEKSEDKDNLLDMIERIKTASIDTIDGFSSKMIKTYFYELEVSPNIEIISDTTRDYYLTKSMDKTIEKLIQNETEAEIMLDLFGGGARNFNNLKKSILNIYNKVINIRDYESFLDNSIDEYKISNNCIKIISDKIDSELNLAISEIREVYSSIASISQNKINDVLVQFEGMKKETDFKKKLSYILNNAFTSFSKKDCTLNPCYNNVNKAIDRIKSLQTNIKKFGVDENFDIKNQEITKYFAIFIENIKIFIKNYNDIKQKNNLIDFNDLNRLMLKLLDNDEIRKEINNKYKYIFIDEYQDVNPLQDELLNKVAGEDSVVFTVGDVKQSIYGFRGASPEWFLTKYDRFKDDASKGKAFDMNINFRSNPKILNFVNEIFANLMTKSSSGIDYKKDAMIEPKRDDIVDDKVKILLTPTDSEDTKEESGVYSVKNDTQKFSKTNSEAVFVVNLITKLIGSPFYDAKLKQTRSLTYKDIAILSRSVQDDAMSDLTELMRETNIPINTSNKLEVSHDETVKLILSILKCVGNIADDVDYAALFLSLTNMTIDNMVEIRDKDLSFVDNLRSHLSLDWVKSGFEVLNRIRTKSYTSLNSELIRYILNHEGLKYYLMSKENGSASVKLVDEFISTISPVEDNLGLCEFINVVESNVSKGVSYDDIDREDSVTISTIHKSKGLEYPVVILYNSSKRFSYITDNDSVNFNENIGLGVDYYNTLDRIKSYGLVKYAIHLVNQSIGYKEELRLLYVALTRAKNKLYITGKYSPKTDADNISKNSYMNMILSVYKRLEGKHELKYCDIGFLDKVEIYSNSMSDIEVEIERVDESFVYPDQEKFTVPIKNTVTGLNSKVVEASRFDTARIMTRENQYKADEDRAMLGTRYHLALEHLDLKSDYEKSTDYEGIDYSKVERAHAVLSPLVKDAVNIYHEKEFMMYVPYCELIDSKIKDKVLVQGMVDLIIEKKDTIIIVDYKFSRLNIKKLKEKYIEQLNLYKLAVEKAYNKKVEHMYIYSIETGELY